MSLISQASALRTRSGEIVSGEASGGTNTSHTIVIEALAALLAAVPPDAPHVEYQRAALDANVLGKQTEGARRRTLRYLTELYLLRPDSLLFRALRDLWVDAWAMAFCSERADSRESESPLRVHRGTLAQ